MGNENSTQIDDSVLPSTLEARTIDAVAKYIKSGRVKKIVVMVGAGISTSAGIPDFRSPETGLYANLARLDLPYPEAVFDISFFKSNPTPFYTLAHELYPGKYRPTITHSFLKLLHDKGLLLKLFTQNIDCLERTAGVPGTHIIEAHGSFATQRCIECREPYPDNLMQEAVSAKQIPYCQNPSCPGPDDAGPGTGLIKPDIVFFGEALPREFHDNIHLPEEADLAIVMGTSLQVQPFASLPGFVGADIPRVLINRDPVGSLGSRADDVLVLGDCDAGVRKLAAALDWTSELESLWAATDPISAAERQRLDDEEAAKSKDEKLEDRIEALTREIDDALVVHGEHRAWVERGLEKGSALEHVFPHLAGSESKS